jgi:hypothetical protein
MQELRAAVHDMSLGPMPAVAPDVPELPIPHAQPLRPVAR